MNSKILDILYASSDYVSGETISESLGVSRTAVWKHINMLKKERYQILSVSNKGYKLIKENLPLNEYEVKRYYDGNMNLIYMNEVESTNTTAKSIASELTKTTLVMAGIQNKGRGRLGKEFSSDNDKGIWTSFIFKPEMEPAKATIFTLAASVAVCKTLKEKCHIDAKIKWPNDIIVNNKKICGILTEMSSEMDKVNYIVVGIGINLLQTEFESTIKEVATSVFLATKQKYERGLLIGSLCYNMDEIYSDIQNNELSKIIDEWKHFSMTIGREVRVIKAHEEFYGIVKDIDDAGRLILEEKSGKIEVFNAGEVSIRGIMGYA
ncbi:MAG: biotin--[acetyl-CoA-carboxylase] ligase [Clostridia bacterium]|nr:biotin--[acetyl-CoA-carboxylase] ligase [Clostridia bacterium]